MPILRVMSDEGHPTQAPCMRILTIPSWVTSTSSMSPPSDCTAGRMRSMTSRTRSFNEFEVGLVAMWDHSPE